MKLNFRLTSDIGHVFSNIAQAYILKILGAALGFSFNVLLARLLGVEGSGVYYLAFSVITISTVIGRLGLDNVVLRFVSAEFSKQNWSGVAGVYKLAIIFSFVASSVVTCLVIVLSSWISNSVFSTPNMVIPLRIIAFTIVPLSLLTLQGEMLKAVGRVQAAIILQGLLMPLVSVAFIFPLVYLYGVGGASLAYVLSCGLTLLVSQAIWRKATPQVGKAESFFEKRLLLSTSFPLFVVALMNLVIDTSDTVMVGIFLDSRFVGIYGVAQRIALTSSILVIAVNSVVAPRFAALWAERNIRELSTLAQTVTRVMALVALFPLILFTVFPTNVLGIFGIDFIAGKNVLIALSIGQFIALATGPVAMLLVMTGHQRFHRNNVVASAVLNVVLNILFIPLWGILGVAIATLLSLTVKNILTVLYVRSQIGIKVFL